jgi:hypothetical protein
VYKNSEIRGDKQSFGPAARTAHPLDGTQIPFVPGGFSPATSLFSSMDYYGMFRCSACGEENEVFVEPEGGETQVLTEDCTVCCRPNVLHIRILPGRIIIDSELEG